MRNRRSGEWRRTVQGCVSVPIEAPGVDITDVLHSSHHGRNSAASSGPNAITQIHAAMPIKAAMTADLSNSNRTSRFDMPAPRPHGVRLADYPGCRLNESI